MKINKIFLKITNTTELSSENVLKILNIIDADYFKIKLEKEFNEIIERINYKKILQKIMSYFIQTYEININELLVSYEQDNALIEYINGLIIFLFMSKFPESSKKLEEDELKFVVNFIENIMFPYQSSKNEVEQVKNENNQLKIENKNLKEANENLLKKIKDLEDLMEIKDVNVNKNVDNTILYKMEKELIELKHKIEYENSIIIQSWFNLSEEVFKK